MVFNVFRFGFTLAVRQLQCQRLCKEGFPCFNLRVYMPKCNNYKVDKAHIKKPNRLLIYICRAELTARKQLTTEKKSIKI